MEKFERYDLSIPSLQIQNMNYLGDDIWVVFRNLYIFCLHNQSLINDFTADFSQELVRESYKYFDEIKKRRGKLHVKKWEMADKYFENFTPLWNLSLRRNKNLWIKVWQMTDKWEQRNEYKLHKGTLFYFWATTALLHGDYDEGMILMHQALNEDRRKDPRKSRSPDTPGYAFVSMDEKPCPYMRDLTQAMVDFVKRRLSRYKGNLDYKALRTKFLDSFDPKFEDIKYLFSYSILRLMKLRSIHKARRLADKQMSSLIFLNALGGLILVIDELFKIAFKTQKSKHFRTHVYFYLKSKGAISEKSPNAYLKRLSSSKLSEKFAEEFIQNKPNTFKQFLSGNFKDEKNNKVSETECQLLLCYCLRNFSAHNIKGVEIFWEPEVFTDLLQGVFSVFFMTIEELP